MLPYQPHSETSTEAAARKPFASVVTERTRVLALLRAHPEGHTDEEIQLWLSMQGSTERPRRLELLRLGLIRDSGEKRHTIAGRRAVVWAATQE